VTEGRWRGRCHVGVTRSVGKRGKKRTIAENKGEVGSLDFTRTC
jgi:hypothetical protein